MTVNATSAITSIQRSAGLNSMQSNTTTRSSNSTMFARCRSPWHSRTKPRRSRSSIAEAIRRCVACVHRSSAAIRAATSGACSSRRTCSKLAAAFASAVAADPHGSAGRAHGTSAWKRAMQPREFVDALRRQRVRREQPVEFLRAVEAAHAHRVLDAVTRAVDARCVRRAGDAGDAEVQIGRKSPVEPQLLLARGAPLRERGEVEEPEVDRLLDLVRVVAGQHDPRDVRLDDLDVRRRMRKAPRVAQGGRERRRAGSGISHGARRDGPARCASPGLLRRLVGEPVDRRVEIAHDVVDFLVGPAAARCCAASAAFPPRGSASPSRACARASALPSCGTRCSACRTGARRARALAPARRRRGRRRRPRPEPDARRSHREATRLTSSRACQASARSRHHRPPTRP